MTRTAQRGILNAAYDGPMPPAEIAALRWGAGAARRIGRGADLALLEARLAGCAAALGRLRRAPAPSAALERLARAVAQYRRAALAVLAPR